MKFYRIRTRGDDHEETIEWTTSMEEALRKGGRDRAVKINIVDIPTDSEAGMLTWLTENVRR